MFTSTANVEEYGSNKIDKMNVNNILFMSLELVACYEFYFLFILILIKSFIVKPAPSRIILNVFGLIIFSE